MTISKEQILGDAICWLAKKINDARPRVVNEPKTTQERPQTVSAQPRAVDKNSALSEARRHMRLPTEQPWGADIASVAVAICESWKKPHAAPFACAWLENKRKIDAENLMNDDDIAILIGIAAAAAVIAVVFFVRQGRTVRIPPGLDLKPSSDFRALCAIASGDGSASAEASRVRDSVAVPWAWTAEEYFKNSSSDDKRVLLEAFAENGACNVARILPAAGDLYDMQRMRTDRCMTKDDYWVVSDDILPSRIGYLIGDRVEFHAQVDVCTIDWWLLSTPTCPVGKAIVERANDLVVCGGDQFATLSNEPCERKSICFFQCIDMEAKCLPNPTDRVTSSIVEPGIVSRIRKTQNDAQCEQPLLAIDYVKAGTTLVEYHGAQDVRNTVPFTIIHGVPDVVKQLHGRCRFPAVWALVVRNPQIQAEQVADCNSTYIAFENGHIDHSTSVSRSLKSNAL